MSDAVIVALIVGFPPTLVAAGAFIQSLKNGAKADLAAVKADAAATAAEKNTVMTNEIHQIVNSQREAMMAEIEALKKRLNDLK